MLLDDKRLVKEKGHFTNAKITASPPARPSNVVPASVCTVYLHEKKQQKFTLVVYAEVVYAAFAQSDQGLRCPLLESLDTVRIDRCSTDAHQIVRIRWLIWVFTVRICPKYIFSYGWTSKPWSYCAGAQAIQTLMFALLRLVILNPKSVNQNCSRRNIFNFF